MPSPPRCADWAGRLDLLVNNAGQGRVSTFDDTTDAQWREELDLKFFSQILPIRAFRPLLEASAAPAIVAVNSLLSLQPEPHMVCTSAARAGVQNLLKSLATEFAPRIRVNTILLGLVDSGQWQRRFDARADKSQTREQWYARARARQAHPARPPRRTRGAGARHRFPRLAGRELHHRRQPRSFGRRFALHLDPGHESHEHLRRPSPSAASAQAQAASTEPVGDAIARALADMGVTTVFGVISIHNMPILDAIARHGRIRFVPARGEAGAMNMADAYARVSRSLGVAITSTGTAAGNAAGSQVEALTAGSPVLHITTQVDREFVDRDRAAIHDVPRQPDMLKAISKSYCRIWEPAAAIDTLIAADARRADRAERPGDAGNPDRRAARARAAAHARRPARDRAPDARCGRARCARRARAAGQAADAVARRRRARCGGSGDRAGGARLRRRHLDQWPRRRAGRPSA